MSKPHVEFVEVDGVNLRVATQRGNGGLPLLLFNGIGANLELCFPFMEAMPEKEIVIFDVPGVGRSRDELAAAPILGTREARQQIARPPRLPAGGRHRRVLGRRTGAAIRAPVSAALPPPDPRGDFARRGHGPRPAIGACRRWLRRAAICRRPTCRRPRATSTAAKRAATRSSCPRTPRESFRRSSWATSINCSRAWAGPASIGCIASANRRWSWPGPIRS